MLCKLPLCIMPDDLLVTVFVNYATGYEISAFTVEIKKKPLDHFPNFVLVCQTQDVERRDRKLLTAYDTIHPRIGL